MATTAPLRSAPPADAQCVEWHGLDWKGYAQFATSPALPFLKAAEVFDWVSRPQTASETEWVKEVRRWVRDVLAPRRREDGS